MTNTELKKNGVVYIPDIVGSIPTELRNKIGNRVWYIDHRIYIGKGTND